ncbi:homoserine O-succinyltransferase [Candidatus Poribacteria bacterium]|nr:homoserine O-succinyltransferase [Candidatus Poribacteria bacterium]
MTLIIRSDYHALHLIEKNGIKWISLDQAKIQDIRPLRIGILNIMPLGEQYELNLLNPLGLSILQIEPIWIKLKSHVYKTWPQEHLNQLYSTYEDATKHFPLDGLIVTGAPVEHLDFEEVRYWKEIVGIINHARQTCPSTLGLCWGAMALAYMAHIPKLTFKQKLFGVFELKNLVTNHPIMGALDDKFLCPQSRIAGTSDDLMEVAQERGKLNLLAFGKESGYSIFETSDQKQIMHMGHPEYNSRRLAHEAKRDQHDPTVPEIRNFDFKKPENVWRMHRNVFFQQWIRYCYMKVSLGD